MSTIVLRFCFVLWPIACREKISGALKHNLSVELTDDGLFFGVSLKFPIPIPGAAILSHKRGQEIPRELVYVGDDMILPNYRIKS